MDSNQFAIAIMAAGKGTRLKSKRPKVLHEIGGRALLLHVIAAAETAVPAGHIFCIIGHEADRVRTAVASTGVQFVLQPEQRGTGHALQMLKADFELSGRPIPQHLLVLSGDVPLIRPETIAAVRDTHLREHAAMTILTAVPADPTGYGRVIRASPDKPDKPEVTAIVEQKSLRPDQLTAPEINSGIYCFETAALFARLDALTTNNAHGEFYLTDIAAMLVAEGKRVVAVKADSVDEVLGANTIAEMMHLDAAMRLATAHRLMAAGITIFRPETCVIDSTVTVGPDTVIEPYVQLLGATRIGSDSRIRSYSVIQNSQLGDNVLVRNGCILDTAEVANNAILGPYAHLRPESKIGDGAHVGNFVETKKATLGKGSKANHLNYLGDTVIGAGVNIGAGAITCNYDGVHKHLTTISDGAFIGSDSTLVAPVTIGAGSYIAAGSSITEDVPDGALALGRSRQTNKPGWVAARKATAKQNTN
ncbi:bifunctional UDP-N-acetylglucosamine diphosphorylase/glucosamine-1-phosphate N-acetyltransferase GlmU [Tunturiibacter empetritectus]|uniref:Bifunctional protein GlmU n=2 Tax=Tunturiibacter TaxID=3154218 RepID=A0A852VC54_9BACT|nr:bifunctional UDP-N-acetylglucosamine diphosphorylase/glucosamine-1-phosphate N-acetyltransferase GlmU [Edaphobacter lichenicola]NYF90478.1 bifunctional UDP-N-acetylglucosamine pyrophosphorylase/glucosamine-1-phosphate N-acetyltransferase [Edaphobacter lichenicola]